MNSHLKVLQSVMPPMGQPCEGTSLEEGVVDVLVDVVWVKGNCGLSGKDSRNTGEVGLAGPSVTLELFDILVPSLPPLISEWLPLSCCPRKPDEQ
jgi:hypothetical protein